MKLHPYQQDLLTKLNGWKPGEMMIISAGRRTGKSMLAQTYNEIMQMALTIPYKNAGRSEVDGELWYTVKCSTEVAKWIRTLPKKDNWYEHIDTNWYAYNSMFDLHERVYLQLGLKFA